MKKFPFQGDGFSAVAHGVPDSPHGVGKPAESGKGHLFSKKGRRAPDGQLHVFFQNETAAFIEIDSLCALPVVLEEIMNIKLRFRNGAFENANVQLLSIKQT